MSKKKLIIILIIISAVIAAVYFSIQSNKPTEQGLVANISKPNITSLPGSEERYILNINEKDFDFPNSLPLLQLGETTQITEDEILQTASNLGFTKAVNIIDGYFQGKSFLWSNNSSSLSVSLKNNSLNFSLSSLPIISNKNLSDNEIISIANNFITKSGFINLENLEFSFFSFWKQEGKTQEGRGEITTKEKANIYQVNFSPKISKYSLLSLDSFSSPNYI